MEYYVKLFELFTKTVGIKLNRNNYKHVYTKFKQDFIEWLDIYKITTYEYRMYLEKYFGIDLDDRYLAELDKGNIDSIIGDEAYAITPYGYTFPDTYHKSAELIVNEDEIKVNLGDVSERIYDIRTYITQNPYLNEKTISSLKKLHDYHNKRIIFGVYGKLHDIDKNSKIRMLKQFKRSVDSYDQEFDLDYNTKEDNYFFAMTKR